MSLPYKKIPAGIAAFTDPTGHLPASQLSHVTGVGDFQIQAARAMRALVAAAKTAGFTVATVGDYRSYDEQVRLFEQRYSPNVSSSRCYSWKGQRWCLKPGAAGAAFPGTSNHGLGLANDFALNVGGQIVSLDQTVNGVSLWTWLNAHGRTYGWSWGEAQSERWHWVYIEGDDIPAAVLAYEHVQPLEEPVTDAEIAKIVAGVAAIQTPTIKDSTGTVVLPGGPWPSVLADTRNLTGQARNAANSAAANSAAATAAINDGVEAILAKLDTLPPGAGGSGLTDADIQKIRDLLNAQRITTDEPG